MRQPHQLRQHDVEHWLGQAAMQQERREPEAGRPRDRVPGLREPEAGQPRDRVPGLVSQVQEEAKAEAEVEMPS